MNGSDETKGVILKNLDDRLRQIEKCGCGAGQVREERIHNMTENMEYMRKTLSEVNSKLFWGLLMLCIISFLAGINVWQEFLRAFVK